MQKTELKTFNIHSQNLKKKTLKTHSFKDRIFINKILKI